MSPPRSVPALLLGVILASSCLVVPSVFTTRINDVFVLPKLAALWSVLAASLVVVAVGVLLGRRSGSGLRWTPAFDVAATSFLVLNVLATAFSIDRHQSLFGERWQYQGLLTLLLYLAFSCLARHIISDERALTLMFGALTAGAVVVAGYALVQQAGLDPVWRGDVPGGRVFSTIGQPNALAAYLLIAVPPSIYLLRSARGALRAFVFLSTAAIVTALLLTRSRGGLAGLLVMTPLVAITLGWSGKQLWRAAAVVSLVFTACVAIVEPVQDAVADSWQRLALASDRGGELSIRNHLDGWRVAARIAADHPILGTGQETFGDVFPRYSHAVLPPERAAYFDAFRVESPHNIYLGIAAGAGIPALIAYVALLAGFARVALAAATMTPQLRLGLLTILAAVLGHLATDAFMTPEITSSWLFWTLIGAGHGVASGARRNGFPPRRPTAVGREAPPVALPADPAVVAAGSPSSPPSG